MEEKIISLTDKNANSQQSTDSPVNVSVVVCTYNEGKYISACLDSIFAQTYTDFEVIVVDDGSSDDTLACIQRYRDEAQISVYALTKNGGVPNARNIGIKAGRGKIVTFIDADAVAPTDWMAHLLEPFKESTVAVVGGPDVAPKEDGLFALTVEYTLQSLIATGNLRRCTPLARYSPAGCNLAIRRSVLDQVGLFDPRLNQRGEEKELEQRIRRQGYQIVYVPTAMIWHHRRATLRSFWRQTFLSGRARVDILRIAPDAFEPAHIFPALLTLLLLASLLGWPWWVSLPWLALPVGGYLALIFINGLLSGIKLVRIEPIAIVPVTTAIIHFGYGIGFLVRMTEHLIRRIRA